jgi:thiamine monophosphate synthase
LQTGVSGIALSSALLQAEDPVAETKKVTNKLWIKIN